MPLTVYAKTVDFTPNRISNTDLTKGIVIAKQLGLKKKSSRIFELLYKGNCVSIATNSSQVKNPKLYTYVSNKGNHDFTFFGLKIGNTRSTVEKVLKEKNYKVSSANADVVTYRAGNSSF